MSGAYMYLLLHSCKQLQLWLMLVLLSPVTKRIIVALLSEVIILKQGRIYMKVWNSILVLMMLWLITTFQPRLFPYLQFSPYRFLKSRLSRLGSLWIIILYEGGG